MDQAAVSDQAPVSNGEALQEELRLLRKDVEKLKSEAGGASPKVAMYLGVVGGLFALVTGLIALPGQINEFLESPDTSLSSEALSVAYQPADSTFAVQIPMILDNKGAGDEIIKSAESQLTYAPVTDASKLLQDQTEGLHAGVGQFTFYDKEKAEATANASQLDLPLYIGKKSGRTISLSILFDKGTFTKAGFNRLDVSLVPQRGKPKVASFCFYLDSKDIAELQEVATGEKKRFLTPSCGA